jgi:organic radical activating enzyme
MFGANEKVGGAHFKNMPPSTLKLTSMFYTLQGEGPLGGRCAFFLRFTKCNLACSFCDTFFDQGDVMTFEQIEAAIHSKIQEHWHQRGLPVPKWMIRTAGVYRCALVITGGEPMLQPYLPEFLERQVGRFTTVQIESNGTISRSLHEDVLLVCSPKCAEKGGRPVKYLQPSSKMLERANCLKFVMSADPDSPYSQVPDWAHQWAHETGKPVYVSPMNVYNDMPHKAKMLRANRQGQIPMEERSTVDEVISFWEPGLLDMKANQRNHEYAARYCMDHGFIFNLQAHLYASLA